MDVCGGQGHLLGQWVTGHTHGGSKLAVKGGVGGGGQEVLQVPVKNGGRTNQYVWSQVFVFVCVCVCCTCARARACLQIWCGLRM